MRQTGEGHELVAEEEGFDQFDVRQVVTANVQGVGDELVARAQALRGHAFEELLDREGHHPQVNGVVAALGDDAAPGISEHAREVSSLLDQWRAGGAHDDHAHLLGDGEEGVAHDFQSNRVGRSWLYWIHHLVSMCRLP